MSSNQDPVSVTTIHWRQVLPWLNLFQALPLGLRLRTLLPALLMIVWHYVALEVAHHFDLLPDVHSTVAEQSPDESSPEQQRDLFTSDGSGPRLRLWNSPLLWPSPVPQPARSATNGNAPRATAAEPTKTLTVSPIAMIAATVGGLLFSPMKIWSALLSLCFALVPMLLLAAAVNRAAAYQFCVQQRIGPINAAAFSLSRLWPAALATALAMLLATLLLAPLSVTGLLSKYLLVASAAGTLWPAIALYAVFVYLAWGVLIGAWFLALAAIATDDCSGADALSRSISYLLTRKAQSIGYAVLVLLLAQTGSTLAEWLLQQGHTVLVVRFEIANAPAGIRNGIVAWSPLLSQLPTIVWLSVFLSGVSIAYVLLRGCVDGIEHREVNGGRPDGHSSATSASTANPADANAAGSTDAAAAGSKST